MFKDLTPEERLLRLIRRKDRSKTKDETQKPIVKKDIYISRLKTIFQQTAIPSVTKEATVNRGTLKIIRKALIAITILSFSYILIVLFWPQKGYVAKSKQTTTAEPQIDKAEAQIEKPKPYNYYSQQVEKKDIFKTPFQEDNAGSSSQDSLQRISQQIKLVGIVLDETPQAIIEDVKEKKTYFLNKGEYLNQIKVEDISEGKVIVSFEGESFELVP